MSWCEEYPMDRQPTLQEIGSHIASGHWEALRSHLESRYQVQPRVEYSQCSGAPGWNVKYRSGGRALCTLYPNEGYFTCMVSIGAREATDAELMLPACTAYVRELYQNAQPFNGGRWLMIEVRSEEILHVINLLEGYGNDNPGAKSQGIKQLMAGGGVVLIGLNLVPLLSGLFG